MEELNFNEIIDYAISKEKEAVKFYQELQNKAKFNTQKIVLKEFENMEKGHINILNNIKQKNEKLRKEENKEKEKNKKVYRKKLEKKYNSGEKITWKEFKLITEK